MKQTGNTPAWVGWLTSIIAYTIGAAIIIPLVYFILGSRSIANFENCSTETRIRRFGESSALTRMKAMVACMERRNLFMENWMIRTHIKTINSLPNAPCQYVGVWNSNRPDCRYEVTLNADGEYTAQRQECRISSKNYSGSWGVYQNRMVWLDDKEVIWPPDANLIESANSNSFVLVEADGSHTVFTRIEDPSQVTGCDNPTTQGIDKVAAP